METTAPIIQQHELTGQCNNQCAFCYNPERCVSTFVPRAMDRACNLAVARASVARGVMAVCLTGGEPLLVGDHFFEVLTIYQEAGCYTSMNSNGRLITKEIAERLADAGLQTALISIHGIDDLHDLMVGDEAFEETWKGIMALQSAGISVTPNFVATAKNVHGLRGVGERLFASGITSMTVTPFLPSWGAEGHEVFVLLAQHYRDYFAVINELRSLGMRIDSTLPIPPCVLMRYFLETWQEYLQVLSPRVCMAGRSFGVVSPDGLFRAGIQAPYLEAFGGSVLARYRESWSHANDWANRKLLPDVCAKCAALPVCGGGCRTSSLWENEGSVAGKTMYMGDALTAEEAALFLDRVRIDAPFLSDMYQWNESVRVRVRDEGWGKIVFNPQNQSFTIVDALDIPSDGNRFSVLHEKTARVLLAVGAIRRCEEGQVSDVVLDAVVLPGDSLLPRLASNLSADEVHCLRADTGERYFF